MANYVSEHISFINAIVAGKFRYKDLKILRSWRRCAESYGLDPGSGGEPAVLESTTVRERQERKSRLLSIAQVEMTNLYQQIAGSGYCIVLTDAEGVILSYMGDSAFSKSASKTGLVIGGVWSEEYQGTNGMGTCIVEHKPLVVHHHEHFLYRNTGLTCAAAPIFDADGSLLAVLDASSDSPKGQQHTMVLVNMSAQTIENRVFLNSFEDHYIVRFHSRPEFVSTLGEGILAFDEGGTVMAANRSALFQLGHEDRHAVCGREIGDIFDVSLSELTDRFARHCLHPTPIYETRRGRRFYASIQPPRQVVAGHHKLIQGLPQHTGGNGRGQPVEAPEPGSGQLDELEHGDPTMAQNVRDAKRIIERDVPILLYGETGTGKEVFAKALHQSSSRGDSPFVAVNCASIPETLIESELFGYRSGAFTGASREGRRGKILQANGGTLFLDEIGDMPVQLQARLLRVLEEKEVLPLGSNTPVKVDIKVISATHRNLPDLIQEGNFREDLYYRLQGLSLQIPSLRERADKSKLIVHVLNLENTKEHPVQLDDEAWRLLETYEWPGNIRQLRHVLRTVLALADDPVITPNHLPPEIKQSRPTPRRNTEGAAGANGNGSENPLEQAEREALIQELERHRWNVTKVANHLNICRNTLYRKMKRHNIKPPNG